MFNRSTIEPMTTVPSESPHTCNLCFRNIGNDYERFLVEGRGKFDIPSELKSIEFNVTRTSRYICRGCIQKLKKRRGLLTQLGNINSSLKSLHNANVQELYPPLKRPAYDVQHDWIIKKIREESTSTTLLPSTFTPVHSSVHSNSAMACITRGQLYKTLNYDLTSHRVVNI